MRIPSLIFKTIGLVAVYAFACGALAGIGDAAAGDGALASRLAGPFLLATPLSLAVLAAGLTLLAVEGAVGAAAPSWNRLLLEAWTVNALVLGVIVLLILLGARMAMGPAELGALTAAGIIEAGIGVVLGFCVVILGRPRLAHVPALGLLLLGTVTLGAMFWLGSAPPR